VALIEGGRELCLAPLIVECAMGAATDAEIVDVARVN
jgi:hypothetical protein